MPLAANTPNPGVVSFGGPQIHPGTHDLSLCDVPRLRTSTSSHRGFLAWTNERRTARTAALARWQIVAIPGRRGSDPAGSLPREQRADVGCRSPHRHVGRRRTRVPPAHRMSRRKRSSLTTGGGGLTGRSYGCPRTRGANSSSFAIGVCSQSRTLRMRHLIPPYRLPPYRPVPSDATAWRQGHYRKRQGQSGF